MSKHTDPSGIVPCGIPDDKRFHNLTGKQFGRLRVESFVGRRVHSCGAIAYFWKCTCACGTSVIVYGGSLRTGNTESCGCWSREASRDRLIKANTVHGLRFTPEYRAWRAMISRCFNPKVKSFKDYGARGIGVCERWRSADGVKKFYSDMGPRPSPKHQIERKDNNAGYSPENCKWATVPEQSRNRRSTHRVEFQGRTMCVTDWEIERGFPRNTIFNRIRMGWPIERAITEPVKIKYRSIMRA